jgi:hypothetical protein
MEMDWWMRTMMRVDGKTAAYSQGESSQFHRRCC